MNKKTTLFDPEQIEIKKIQSFITNYGKRILDVGSGDGRLTSDLSINPDLVIGMDINFDELLIGKNSISQNKLNNISFCAASGNSIPVKNNYFDIVFFSWSF